jgi:hypothetical protein
VEHELRRLRRFRRWERHVPARMAQRQRFRELLDERTAELATRAGD